MIAKYNNTKIFLACGNTDMRKSINGLCQIVQTTFEVDPFSNQMFVFCNRSRNRLKILHWEDNGFWLHFKRIERGSFKWPTLEGDDITMNLAFDELMNLINAPGLEQKIKRKELLIGHQIGVKK